MFSQAEVQPSRARLIVDCKEAPEASADLRDPKCLAAVLGHLEREFGIEAVVLSHYVEKQYGPKAMETLRRLLALSRLLGQIAVRDPAPNFPGMARKQVAARCAACPFNPHTLFPKLRERVLGDFSAFHAEFLRSTEALHRYREAGCKACTGATANDLIYLFREAVAFGEASIEAAPPPPEGTE